MAVRHRLDTFALRSYTFRREREANWRELERIIARAEKKGLRRLEAEDLVRLPVLYRATLSSLSVARSISLDRNVIEYLEALCSRAYFVVYGPKRSAFSVGLDFVRRDFPLAVRGAGRHLGLSTLFFACGFVTAYAMVLSDPSTYYAFVDAAYSGGRDPSATTEFLRDGLYDDGGQGSEGLSLFATFLFSHNAQIGIMAFALGIAAGLPVFLLMFMNGLILGAFLGLYQGRGLGIDLASWILPHGVTEVLAVLLCGAAGLLLADGVLFPGVRGRVDGLRTKGRQAGQIVVGAVCMFFLAALIEGYFRQLVQSLSIRFLVVLITGVFWIAYLGFAGRSSGRESGS